MPKHMEDSLDIPLRKILPVIQKGIMNHTSYFGIRTLKSPLDAWVYQEIIYETKPDVIVEIGNADGGSALFLAHICDNIGKGRIIAIDLSHKHVPEQVKQHPRITLIEGDAIKSFEKVEGLITNEERVLVIEDSSHTYENTLNVLRIYSKLVKAGGYFIVEDSNLQHGLQFGPKPGPYEAIETFLIENELFKSDRSREHFFLTWNPKGYLRRSSVKSNKYKANLSDKVQLDKVKRSTITDAIKLFIPPILLHLIRKLFRIN